MSRESHDFMARKSSLLTTLVGGVIAGMLGSTAQAAGLSSVEAQGLVIKATQCSAQSCTKNLFSEKISSLELRRTAEMLKTFKVSNQAWSPCELKVRILQKNEVCYLQTGSAEGSPDKSSEKSVVRLIFSEESGHWKILSISKPIVD